MEEGNKKYKQIHLARLPRLFQNRDLVKPIIYIILLFHLLTLSVSPMPWFDEVCFVDISYSLSQGNGFKLEIAPFLEHSENIVHYGPVFFSIQAAFIKLLGLNVWTARIPGFVFAVLSCVVLIRLFEKTQVKLGHAGLLLLILFPTVSSTLHNGRMEFVAIFFWLSSIYFILQRNVGSVMISAILFVIMLLTTPRSLLFLFGTIFLFIWVWRYNLSGLFLNALLYGVVIFLGEWIWAVVSVGSLSAYLELLGSSSEGFVGGGFPFRTKDLPMLGILIASILSLVIPNVRKQILQSEKANLLFFSMIIILSYVLLVKETGPYLVYMAIPVILLSSVLKEFGIGKLVFSLSIIVLLTFQFFKFGLLISELSERDPAKIRDQILKVIPKGSSLIISDQYYYMLRSNEMKLNYLHHKDFSEIMEYNSRSFQAEFVLLNSFDDFLNPEWKSSLIHPASEYELYQEFGEPYKKPWLGLYVNSYSGILFKRKGISPKLERPQELKIFQ